MKKHYKKPAGFSSDPFNPLYNTDNTITNPQFLVDVLDYAQELQSYTVGDFDLPTVITEIKGNFLGFVKTGLMSYLVKTKRLYSMVYDSFEQFCKEAIGVTHWQINRMIDAARVVLDLIKAGFKVVPMNEAQARCLTKLSYEDLIAKWRYVLSKLSPSQITSKAINDLIGNKPARRNLSLPVELYEAIEKQALEAGMSVQEFLQATFIDDQEEVQECEEEQEQKWQEDMKDLQKDEPIGTNNRSKIPIELLGLVLFIVLVHGEGSLYVSTLKEFILGGRLACWLDIL